MDNQVVQHESSWFPGRTSGSYRTHFDEIKWGSTKKGVSRKGKARQSTSSRMLEVDETLKAVKTPIAQRTDKTFRYVE
jgi:hypothetical protein